jgi:hypothetical protein
MTEQHPDAPVPGPPTAGHEPSAEPFAEPFAELEHRPVAEHVAVFETEHARLQQELSSIDQL